MLLDGQYLRDTGNLLYAAEVPKKLINSSIKIVLDKPVPEKPTTNSQPETAK